MFYRQDSDTFSWSSLFSINSIDGYGLMSNNNEGGFQLESPGSVSVVGGSCSHNNSNNLNNIDNNLNNDNENDDNNDGNDNNNNDINESNSNNNIIGNRIKIKDELITREDKHIKRGIAELGSTDGISYTDKNGEIREIRENGFRRQKLSTTYPPLTPQSIQSNQSNLSIVSTGTNSENNNLGNNLINKSIDLLSVKNMKENALKISKKLFLPEMASMSFDLILKPNKKIKCLILENKIKKAEKELRVSEVVLRRCQLEYSMAKEKLLEVIIITFIFIFVFDKYD